MPLLFGSTPPAKKPLTSAPLSGNGTVATPLSISKADTSTDGYLSHADWATFNAKQAAGNYITALTGEVTASGPGSSAATLSNAAVIAKVLTGFSAGAGTVSATDSILAAIQKVVGNIALDVPYTGATSNLNMGAHTVTAQAFLPYGVTDIGGSATPNVSAGNVFNCTNASPTTITNFLGGSTGQTITITFQDGNTTIQNNANIVTASGADYNPGNNTSMSLVYDGSNWNEVGRYSASGTGNVNGVGAANRLAMWTNSSTITDVPPWPIQIDVGCEII